MARYVLNMAGSGECDEFVADNDTAARKIASGMLADRGFDAAKLVFCDSWDSDGENDEGQPCKRLLVWANESDADNDDGANAIAEISTIGRPW